MKNILRKITHSQPVVLSGLLSMCLVSSNWAATVTTFATGLNNPRGLKFGPDGNLYVAEGGTGGLNASTTGVQVVAPVGPYTGNVTGARISKIDPTGMRTTVIDNLPSSQNSPDAGSSISGVADIAWIGNTLYALIAGAGASHGIPTFPNGVIRVNDNGTYEMVANLSKYYMNHPVQNPSTDDFEPDGVPYSMISYNGDLYTIEPNRGSFDRIGLDGKIERVLDTSALFGTVYVPTVMVERDGKFYLGNLDSFIEGGANILMVNGHGKATVTHSGFTDILGIAMDRKGQFYVLENSTGDQSQGPTPYTGDIVRIGTDGDQKVVVSGLFFPTGITIGPDGSLYVSNVGYGPVPNGLGEILKITFN